jgi:hypothetical protein
MRTQIVGTAEQIRQILRVDESIRLSELQEMIPEKPEIVFQALGWLARGDEIQYCQMDNHTVVTSATTYHEFLW